MANINPEKALERARVELHKAFVQFRDYSGIDKDKARIIDNTAIDIAVMATAIAAEARLTERNMSGKGLVRKVRKALGFTVP